MASNNNNESNYTFSKTIKTHKTQQANDETLIANACKSSSAAKIQIKILVTDPSHIEHWTIVYINTAGEPNKKMWQEINENKYTKRNPMVFGKWLEARKKN